MIDALPLLLGPEGYQINRSVRLRSSASAYFNRTPASASNRKTWTWSGWVKRGALAGQDLFNAYQDANNQTLIAFSSDTLIVYTIHGGGSFDYGFQTTAVFRDPSAWYHIVAAFDSSNATAANRAIVYVNGVQQAGSMAFGDIPLHQDGIVNSTNAHSLGRRGGGSQYFDGYLTEVNFIDGQALTPSSFGETNPVTGVWQPKKYAGTYGTNGFYLNFSDNSAATAAAIGKDYSGNGNNWTPNNISVTAGVTYDSMLDVPTQWADGGNGRGNYATLNPVDKHANSAISNGNLTTVITSGGSSPRPLQRSTIFASSGKWYWEVTLSAGSTISGFGVANNAALISDALGYNANGWGWYGHSGGPSLYHNNVGTSYGTAWSVGDVGMVALDMDTGRIWFGRNGTWFASSDPATNTSPAYSNVTGSVSPTVSDYGSGSTETFNINFGQRPFAFSVPTGFKALNTLNLPQPTILKGNQFFNTITYTGTGSTRTQTGVGFQPDFTWVKRRDAAADHGLMDSARGASQRLQSNLTAAEDAFGFTAFASDGFTFNGGIHNDSGWSFVAWNWKEGATQGFDIVTYTGTGVARTVAHSLGVAPKMMIIKSRSASGTSWNVYHASTGNTGAMFLEATNAFAADSTRFNNTSPTSTDFTVGTGAGVNGSGSTFVAYLFSEVAGFSKAFSYTGNGSADGTFVFLGFRPRWIMFKKTSGTSNWSILDTARDDFNVSDNPLLPNTSGAETTSTSTSGAIADILSNGFKLRGNSGDINDSGATYIGFAFAENPLKFSLAR
jgi:hypothetical protein